MRSAGTPCVQQLRAGLGAQGDEPARRESSRARIRPSGLRARRARSPWLARAEDGDQAGEAEQAPGEARSWRATARRARGPGRSRAGGAGCARRPPTRRRARPAATRPPAACGGPARRGCARAAASRAPRGSRSRCGCPARRDAARAARAAARHLPREAGRLDRDHARGDLGRVLPLRPRQRRAPVERSSATAPRVIGLCRRPSSSEISRRPTELVASPGSRRRSCDAVAGQPGRCLTSSSRPTMRSHRRSASSRGISVPPPTL